MQTTVRFNAVGCAYYDGLDIGVSSLTFVLYGSRTSSQNFNSVKIPIGITCIETRLSTIKKTGYDYSVRQGRVDSETAVGAFERFWITATVKTARTYRITVVAEKL